MPSLQEQLSKLQTPVSKSLGVEKRVDSLLFDTKEAASFTSEEFFNLGIAGLQKLRKLDRSLADYEQDLFHESKISFNRAVLSTKDNEDLDLKLRKIIVHICPYFHHQSCRQVLEWLIHKYQIHLYNADLLINVFLLYHASNSFGRLLSLLDLKKKEWNFISEFALKGLPVPFDVLIKASLQSGAVLVSSFSNSLNEAVQLVGESYVEEKMQMHFTFFASLVVHLFADSANITDELIARIIPYVGISLRSRILPYRTAGYMIVCDLAMNASLNEETLHNILKLCLAKLRPQWFEMAMNTVFVITQYQRLSSFPTKSIVNLLRKGEELGLADFLSKALKSLDLSGFSVPLINTIISQLTQDCDSETTDLLFTYLDVIMDVECASTRQAEAFLGSIITDFVKADKVIPERIRPLVKNIIIRFSEVFDGIRAEHHLTESKILQTLMEQCKIAEHEVGVLDFSDMKKRRRRRSSRMIENDESLASELKIKAKVSRTEQLDALADETVKKRFKKPLSVIIEMLESELPNKEEVEWALNSLQDSNYLSKQSTGDLSKFVWTGILFVTRNPKSSLRKAMKLSLIKITDQEALFVKLLNKVKAQTPKKAKTTTESLDQLLAKESDEEFESRLGFTLEVLVASLVVKPTQELIHRLFYLISATQNLEKQTLVSSNATNVQQLSFAFLVKSLSNNDVIALIQRECQADVLINVIRFTFDPQVLRNALKILTTVAPKMPGKLTSQVMSLFAFMGDGLLKKDNEMTLSVVEHALEALTNAVLKPLANNVLARRNQLIEISRIFSKALPDIPAHRRVRVITVISNCVDPTDLWLVFAIIYEDFCVNWQKGKNKNWEEELDSLCLDLMTSLAPWNQIQVLTDILDYIVSLSGDDQKAKVNFTKDNLKIFDGASQPLRKLRHYRYITIGFVVKAVSQRKLFDQLANMTDEEIYEKTSNVGMKMLEIISAVDDFVIAQLNLSETQEQKSRGTDTAPTAIQALKYWIALSARAEVIADKMRCMLPANVSGHIICDLLENTKTSQKMRDRALQLLNVKLLSEVQNDSQETNESVKKFDHYLVKFATLLNKWIKPAVLQDDVNLCQNAAFSLKLLAKRIKSEECRPIFVETLNKCCDLLKKWDSFDEAMIGNVLLLVAELIRSASVSSSLMEHYDAICLCNQAILKRCVDSMTDIDKKNEATSPATAIARRQRHRAHSMSGKQFGEEVVFVCALTLLLRLLEHETEGTSSYHEDFLVIFAQLSARHLPVADRLKEEEAELSTSMDTGSHKVSHVKHRLQQVQYVFVVNLLAKLQEPFAASLKKLDTNVDALGSLGLLLAESIKHNESAKSVASTLLEFIPLLFELLELRGRLEPNDDLLDSVNTTELAAIKAFVALSENLSEVELTPVFGELADWVEQALESSSDNKLAKYKVITVYHLANKFYDSFNTLALPYFNRLFSYVPKLLQSLNVAKTAEDELFIDGRTKGSVDGRLSHQLITLLLDFTTRCAKNRVFMGEDRAELVYISVLDELENRKLRGHEQRCVAHLTDTLYYLAESSVDLFNTSMCQKLLDKFHHSNARVRYRALLVFENFANRAGDALTPMLPVIVQYLTETLEDSDTKVAEQCDRTIRLLKSVFGEEILKE